jgi:hypothetical protein
MHNRCHRHINRFTFTLTLFPVPTSVLQSTYVCVKGERDLRLNFQTFQDPRHQFHRIGRLVSETFYLPTTIALRLQNCTCRLSKKPGSPEWRLCRRHSWASASFSQSSTISFRYRTGFPYSGIGLVQASAFLFVPVLNWPDAGQSGVVLFHYISSSGSSIPWLCKFKSCMCTCAVQRLLFQSFLFASKKYAPFLDSTVAGDWQFFGFKFFICVIYWRIQCPSGAGTQDTSSKDKPATGIEQF